MTAARIELPEKLIPVFSGRADVRGAKGGRGSAKTRSFAKMTAVEGYRFGTAGISGIILCARQFMNSLDDSSLEEVKRAIESEPWLAAYYEIGEKYIRSRDGRIQYAFAGLDRNIGSVKSKGRILLCWVDEAEPVAESAWSTLVPTLREEGDDWNAELWITWNPMLDTAAVEQRFCTGDDPLVKIVELNYRDNPRFPAKLERDRQRDLKKNPRLYANIWEGRHLPAVQGAIYFDEIAQAEADKRVGCFPRDPRLKVHRIWDMGWNDAMAIILAQRHGSQMTVVGFVTGSHRTVSAYHAEMSTDPSYRGWNWGKDFLPHDAFAGNRQTGEADADVLRRLGCDVVQTPGLSVEQGIRAARDLFPRVYFDEQGCKSDDEELPGLVECLKRYRRRINQQTKLADGPLHDVYSNGADAYRYLAINAEQMTNEDEKPLDLPIDDETGGSWMST